MTAGPLKSAASINEALRIAQFRGAERCPATIIPLLSEIGVSARRGKPLRLSEADSNRMRSRLVALNELSSDFLTDHFKRIPEDGNRIELSRMIGNEKLTGSGVAVEFDPGKIAAKAQLTGPDYGIRNTGKIAHSFEELVAMAPPGIILVENEAAFHAFESLDFPVPAEFAGYLVVFRGSPNKSQKICERAIRQIACPVAVFPDFDPAGLMNALAAPNMTRILWPGPALLRKAMHAYATSDAKYLSQVSQAEKMLRNCEHGEIRQIWEIIKDHGRGLAQEAFIRS